MTYHLFFHKAFVIFGFTAAITLGVLIGANFAAVDINDRPNVDFPNTFVHPEFGFSFDYKQNVEISRSAYSVMPYAEIIVAADKRTQMDGFHIIIYNLESDEEGWQTIQKDLDEIPSSKLEKKITVGGVEAMVVSSHNGELPLFIVRFVRHQRRYEITTHADVADALMDVLTTWRFHD
jgi:hypothetical protein